MEQKKIEKLIWDIRAKTTIPDIPDKKNTWKNLEYLIDDSKTSINLSSTQLLKNIWPNWNFKYKYAIIVTLTIILALPFVNVNGFAVNFLGGTTSFTKLISAFFDVSNLHLLSLNLRSNVCSGVHVR